MLFASAAALGFNAPMGPTSIARTSPPTMGHKEDLDLLVSRFGPTSYIHQEQQHSRRQAIQLGAAAMGASALAGFVSPAQAADGMFSLPPLPYAYDALEPHIDAATMKFHHDFHHQAYINNLNKAMAGKPDATLVSLMKGAKAAKLNNAGGGHYNHCLFWTTMGKDCGGAPSGELAAKIDAAFGSFDDFKTQFGTAAAGVFGSGWAWLAVAKDGSVKIVTTPNQVWEHAYYLKYQNRRPEYIAAYWNVVDWNKVGEYYAGAAKGEPVSF